MPCVKSAISGRKRKVHIHKWLLTTAVIIIAQAADFVDIPDDPKWYLYVWGALIDSAVLFLVLLIRFKTTVINIWVYEVPCWIVLGVLQISAVFCHLGGLITEILYNMLKYEQLAVINDQYTPWLITIIVLKLLTLLVGGYGIRQRFIDDHRARRGSGYGYGFVVIRDTLNGEASNR